MKGIYKIVNTANSKYYVGRSVNVERRLNRHRAHLRGNYHDNVHLQNAWNKYGEKNFQFFLVKEVICNSQKELVAIEQTYLDVARREQDKCYNLEFQAEGGDCREETRKRRSDSKKGKLNPWYGKKGVLHPLYHNKEAGEKIRRKAIGVSRNKTIYTFIHRENGEVFAGTPLNFRTKYKLKFTGVFHIVHGQKKSYAGWIAMKNGQPIPYIRKR